MTTPAFIALTLLVLTVACTFWYIECLHRTKYTRNSILELIRRRTLLTQGTLLRDFNRVSYKEHLRCILLLRDPLQLYSQALRVLCWKEASRDFS